MWQDSLIGTSWLIEPLRKQSTQLIREGNAQSAGSTKRVGGEREKGQSSAAPSPVSSGIMYRWHGDLESRLKMISKVTETTMRPLPQSKGQSIASELTWLASSWALKPSLGVVIAPSPPLPQPHLLYFLLIPVFGWPFHWCLCIVHKDQNCTT